MLNELQKKNIFLLKNNFITTAHFLNGMKKKQGNHA